MSGVSKWMSERASTYVPILGCYLQLRTYVVLSQPVVEKDAQTVRDANVDDEMDVGDES